MAAQVDATAMSAAGFAADAARKLRQAGARGDVDAIELAAAECVQPLMRATMLAIEAAGLLNQERSAAVRDVMADYLLERAL